jgi:Domain of unknown function (DUF3598)
MALTLFPKHHGVWKGTYTRLAPNGDIIDKHNSYLTLTLNGKEWSQTNEYTWENGKREFHDFGMSRFDDNDHLQFDNPRIKGEAWESESVIVLWWTYKDQPGTMLYEIITLTGENSRMRTWQHSRNGVFEGLTMIEEHRVV